VARRNLKLQTRFRIDFLDTDRVMRKVRREQLRPLAKSAGYIRRTAKQSIRKRKGPSAPGTPPHSHEGSLRRLMLFGFDRLTDSFVIGPLAIGQSPVPAVLEHGGHVRVRRRRKKGVKKREYSARKVKIRQRAYMEPALQVALKNNIVTREIRTVVSGGF